MVGEIAGRSELDSNRARLTTTNLLESDRLDFVPGDRSADGRIFESAFAYDQPHGRSEPLGRRPDFRGAVQEQPDAGYKQDNAGGSLPGSHVVATNEEAEYPAGGHDDGHEQVALGTATIVVDRNGRPQGGVVHLDGVCGSLSGHRVSRPRSIGAPACVAPTMMTWYPPICRRISCRGTCALACALVRELRTRRSTARPPNRSLDRLAKARAQRV